LSFFAPQKRHVAPMGVKFGTEEETPSVPNFTPSVQRLRPPKLKFLLKFDQNVAYKCPAGAYPLRDFHKICRVCTPFQDALAVKISMDLLKGLWSYGRFKLTGSGYPQIFIAPSGKAMRQTLKSFRGARMCSRSSITMPSLVGLGFHPPLGRPKTLSFFVCLFVCLFVTLLNVRNCAPDCTMKALEYRNDSDAV